MVETQLDKLYKLVETVYEDLEKVKEMISKLQLEARKEALKDVPGVEGVFDGKYLITDTHEKVEVPANYAAKSRIVYGDRLKSFEDDGKQVFKQLEKVSRKKIEAVVSKKEGKFYALAENGSYELSPIAVEFNKVNINDKVQIIIPEDNIHAPYAALDKILDQKAPESTSSNINNQQVAKSEKVVALSNPKEFVMDLGSTNTEKSKPSAVTNQVNVPAKANNTVSSNKNTPSSNKQRKYSKPTNRSNNAPINNRPKFPSKPEPTQPENTNNDAFKPFILEDDDLR